MEHDWAPVNGYSGMKRGIPGTSEDVSGRANGGPVEDSNASVI